MKHKGGDPSLDVLVEIVDDFLPSTRPISRGKRERREERERNLVVFEQLGTLLLESGGEQVAFHVKGLRVQMHRLDELKAFQLREKSSA